MTCPNCDKNKKSGTRGFPKAVVEINNPDKLILFRKVVVPASMGTERDFPATVGKYHNVLLQYEINGDTYLYSSDGIPTQISSDVSELQHQLNQLNIRLTDEIGERISADNDLTDALNAEILARQTGDATLQTALDTEESERKAADATLQSHINSEKAARIAADNTLQGNIDTEATTRATNDTALSARITEETTNRTNADTALGTRITNETTARQNADNTLDGKITTEANTRSAADSALAGDISAEVTRAKAAETALGGRIDDEVTTRTAADTTLDGKITTEATARANADTVLDGKITDEATTRANADTALGTRITNETTARTNADTALGTRIDNEATARANADTAIENKLNRNVLYDLEMETDANNVTFVEDKINLKTGATTTERDVIPAASRTTAGTISASEYISLVDAEEKITALLEGAVAIDNLPANPTQAQLTAAWKTATGKDELINRASIYDSANGLVHTYYTNVAEWEDSPAGAQITIDQFTNSAAGIIKGSSTDGNVSANLDGTGTVSGWTSLKNTVAGKQDALTAGNNISISGSTISATDTTYSAGTGLSLTGTTFAVDTTTIAEKSDIPTVNNATLTIQKNGSTVKTFTANASTNVTANITVPTKTSDLTNDSNFPVDASYVHTDNNFTTALKNKLDGIAAGAEVNQNAFSNVKVGGTTVAADSKTDTLELVAGSNITLTPDATNDKVTIAATDTNTTYTFANGTNGFTVTPSSGSAQTVTVTPSIANATTSTAGLMSAADKTEFDLSNRVERRLIADGTTIPELADLNTVTYLSIGRYVCGGDARAINLVNCPTTKAFVMEVFNANAATMDNETTATWIYRLRKIRDREGNEWTQRANSSSAAGSFTYGDWKKNAFTSDLPTVNNATLTIQKNGTNVQTFTANSSTNKTANITVPTKVTDLTDAANYVAKDGDFYVTGEGSNFSMTGTSQNVYADIKIKGDTSQQTYTGKNIANYVPKTAADHGLTSTYDASTGIITVTGTVTDTYADIGQTVAQAIPAGTYTMKVYVTSGTAPSGSQIAWRTSINTSAGTIYALTTGAEAKRTFDVDTTWARIYITSLTANTSVNFSFKVQVEAGSSATAFEPYVGGIASPNPDYPQEVEVVTGRQIISSCGKNLLNINAFANSTENGVNKVANADGSITINGHTTTGHNFDLTHEPIHYKQGQTYTLSARIASGSFTPYQSGQTWAVLIVWGKIGSTQQSMNVSSELNTLTFTADSDYDFYPRLWFGYNSTGTTAQYANFNDLKLQIQLEKGSQATQFEKSFAEDNLVDLTGKNLLDMSTLVDGYVQSNGEFNTGHNNGEMRSGFIPVSPNTTYTFKIFTTSSTYQAWYRIVGYTAEVPSVGYVTHEQAETLYGNITAEVNFTTHANTKYVIVSARNMAAATQVQFNEGGAAGTYEAYNPIELCKIDGYQDKIYKNGDDWYLHKEVLKVQLTGSESYMTRTNTSTTHGKYRITSAVLASNIADTTALLCPYFIANAGANNADYSENAICGSLQSGYQKMLWFSIANSIVDSLDAFKTWVTNNRPIVYYAVATPTETKITNEALIAQLDGLWRNLQSGTNTTNVNVEGDLPAILGVTAFTNTLASAMAGINERMNRLPAIPQITMTTTDPGEGQPLADNHYIAVYEA